MERSAGILLPVFSLPSPWGIGTMGEAAYRFADFLHRAGQRWWQILPVGPAGAGNSPYSSLSSYAGEPLLIDPQLLFEDGLVTAADLAETVLPDTDQVDYTAVAAARERLLRRAWKTGRERDQEVLQTFTQSNFWVEDYALYMALRSCFGGRSWQDWPDEALRRREQPALEQARRELAEEIGYHSYVQLLFDRQWQALRRYVNGLGIGIIGDLPIYVSLDSADAWASPESFLLDGEGRPAAVAGVPPDYFSEDGQLWGNPLYNWPAMAADGFGWWIRRVDGAGRRFDALRIDHFRAFESYWAVPAGAETAREGHWEPGPGMALVGVLTSWFPQITFIAEDLGLQTPAVRQLLADSGLPGMRVLEFAFDGPGNSYLPHHYVPGCICYTGTHDNDTLRGWWETAEPETRAFARRYLGLPDGTDEAACRAVLRCGQGSVAELFVAQLQDYLGLGSRGRINIPGTAWGNWRWRLRSGELTDALAEEIRTLTATFGRC